MPAKILFSIIESPTHPNFSELYFTLGFTETKIYSMRKALAQLKMAAANKQPPDFIVTDFFYGYGNNYAGVNISNMDVLLYSLQKYNTDAKVIALADKDESNYAFKLNKII